MTINDKLTSNVINLIKVLRMNGLSYRQIAENLDISVGSAHNYGNEVAVLPKRLQQNPFDAVKKIKEKILDSGVPSKKLVKKAQAEAEYWIQEHESGTRWEGPLDIISLDDLKEQMMEPTDYHSPLTTSEWINYYTAEMAFGKGNFLSNTQILINNFLDNNDRALVKVFRGVGKTSLIEQRMTHEICENRDRNYAFQSRESSVSIHRVNTIRTNLMINKKIIAHYGFLPHQKEWRGVRKTWRQSEITVKRPTIQHDPTLRALSWKDTKMLGGHIDGVAFDDIWSAKLQEFAERNREKWFNWYDGTFRGCLNPDAFEHLIFTPKAVNDPYKDLENRGTFAVYAQPAVYKFPSEYKYVENNQGVIHKVDVISNDWHISDDCNNRFNIEHWLMTKKNTSPLKWEQEFQINPLPPKGIILNWDDLRFIESAEDFFKKVVEGSKYQKIIGCMDLAFGLSDRADYTALLIIAILGNKYYVLDGWVKRGASKRDKAKIIENAKIQFPSLSKVYIEADLQQSEDVRELQKMINSVYILPVQSRHEMQTLKRYATGDLSGKEVRILSQLEDPLETHSLYINKQMACYDEFEREFRRFPRGEHDDVLDALGNGLSKLAKKRALLFGISGV